MKSIEYMQKADQDAHITETLLKTLNKNKRSSAVDTGQSVAEIDINDYFIYF